MHIYWGYFMKKMNVYLTFNKNDEFSFCNTDDSIIMTAPSYQEVLNVFNHVEDYFQDTYDEEYNVIDKSNLLSDSYKFDVQNILITDTSDDTLEAFKVFSNTLKNVTFSGLSLDDISYVFSYRPLNRF